MMRETRFVTRCPRSRLAFALLIALTGSFLAAPPGPVRATDPTLLQISLQLVTNGLSSPVYVTNAGDNRLFVVEQVGRIRIVKNGALLPTPFLDIRSTVTSGGEEGLLSLAFHPQYATNGFFYVFHTLAGGGGDNVVERYHVSASPDQADAASATLILRIPHPTGSPLGTNHNGGLVMFGPDGKLYIGTGDGGGGGDPLGHGQSLTTLSGKLLRIDVDHGSPYVIPSGNPFANEIWAYGLRNPWRYAFDPPSGLLYIADVGQGNWEEVDVAPATTAGVNYGWNIMEGTHCYPPGTTTCNMTGLTQPVTEYPHNPECSVTGGFVYRGAAYPQMAGLYFFGDYCSGRIWLLDQPSAGTWRRTELLDTTHNISSFGIDQAGELYLTDVADGGLYRIVIPTAPLPGQRSPGATNSNPSGPLPPVRPALPSSGPAPSPLPPSR